MENINISNSERLAMVGATGSGKTVLAKKLLRGLNRCVVIDPKHMFSLEGYKLAKLKHRLPRREFRVILRPFRGEDEQLSDFLYDLYDRKNVYIYVDELSTLAESFPESTEALEEIARTGRERHLALWAAMQRPRNVPRAFLTETESFFIFLLRSKEDRDTIRGFTGDEVLIKIPRFVFWYFHFGNPALMRYNIKADRVEQFETKGG